MSTRFIFPFIVLASLFAAGCVEDPSSPAAPDLVDRYTSTAMVTYEDGVTPIPDFYASSYNVIFTLKSGANIVWNHSNTLVFGPTTTAQGILTGPAGGFLVSEDAPLLVTKAGIACTTSCDTYALDCSGDDVICDSYCASESTDCHTRDYTDYFDFDKVESVETYLSYNFGGIPVTSIGIAMASAGGVVADESYWDRVETFVTPFDVPAAASRSSKPGLSSQVLASEAKRPFILTGAKATPRQVSCAQQSILSDAAMDRIRKLRADLGVSPDQVLCRQ